MNTTVTFIKIALYFSLFLGSNVVCASKRSFPSLPSLPSFLRSTPPESTKYGYEEISMPIMPTISGLILENNIEKSIDDLIKTTEVDLNEIVTEVLSTKTTGDKPKTNVTIFFSDCSIVRDKKIQTAKEIIDNIDKKLKDPSFKRHLVVVLFGISEDNQKTKAFRFWVGDRGNPNYMDVNGKVLESPKKAQAIPDPEPESDSEPEDKPEPKHEPKHEPETSVTDTTILSKEKGWFNWKNGMITIILCLSVVAIAMLLYQFQSNDSVDL